MPNVLFTPDDVWREVSTQLGYDLEPAIKAWLQKEGYVDVVLAAKDPKPPLRRLLQAAREAISMVNSAIEERQRDREPQEPYLLPDRRKLLEDLFLGDLFVEEEHGSESDARQLLGLLIAKKIGRSEEIQRFRNEYLSGGLLAGEQVPIWIHRTAPSNLPMNQVFSATGFVWNAQKNDYVVKPAEWYYHDLVSSPLNELSPRDRLLQVGGDATALGQLVRLAMEFSERSGWAYGETVWFLLTGEPPALPSIRVFPIKIFSDSGPRILMEVATEAGPEDVRQAYKQRRETIHPSKRSNPLSDKTVAFVRFVFEHEEVDPDRPQDWQSLVAHWNHLQEVKDKSWQIEGDERRRISNTYKRAIAAILAFSIGFDFEGEVRLRREADAEAGLAAEYERIYGDPWQGSRDDPGKQLYSDLRQDVSRI